jgi:hypothetical protein
MCVLDPADLCQSAAGSRGSHRSCLPAAPCNGCRWWRRCFYSRSLRRHHGNSARSSGGWKAATWLCLAGVLCLAVGMRTMLSSWGRGGDVAKMSWRRRHPEWIWSVCFRYGLLRSGSRASSPRPIGWKVTSLHQFLVPLTNLKVGLLFHHYAIGCCCTTEAMP